MKREDGSAEFQGRRDASITGEPVKAVGVEGSSRRPQRQEGK